MWVKMLKRVVAVTECFSFETTKRESAKMSSFKSMKNENKKIFVSNVPYEFKLEELEELFKKEVGDVLSVVYYKDPKDIFLGCITVEFIRVESAQMAIDKMNDFEINGNKLIVKEDNIERDKSGYPLLKTFHTIIGDAYEFTVPKISILDEMNQGEDLNLINSDSEIHLNVANMPESISLAEAFYGFEFENWSDNNSIPVLQNTTDSEEEVDSKIYQKVPNIPNNTSLSNLDNFLGSLSGEEDDSFSSATLDMPKSSKWWRKLTCCLN
ncbi:RNA recognition motif domain [Cinara cedri]|uniref:RNA recognition motif domain n=1 Tax=Cinara cedri TaxID=506608 RepID=A0A5E4LZQ7_9HEMI|nr:RNA recognition motif domain [Cinara cedri]